MDRSRGPEGEATENQLHASQVIKTGIDLKSDTKSLISSKPTSDI